MYLTMQVLSFNKILSKPMDIFKSTTNAALVPYNKQKLRNLEQPIAIISAVNKPPSLAKLASPKHAYGLLNNIMVCKGSKVGI